MSVEVRVDRAICAGTANCQYWAPDAFDLDEDNKAFVLEGATEDEEAVLAAAEGCPTGAIHVWRDGQRLI